MVKNQANYLSFYLGKGNFEVLKSLEQTPMKFKDLRNLINPITQKKYSSRTIALRLKELESTGDIQNAILTKPRKTVGYQITDKGKKALRILKETQEKFEKLKE